jgi:nucleoside-triphosphatase
MTTAVYVFTGPPGCGKTTLVRTIAERLMAAGVPVGGMLTSEVRSGGSRIGFDLQDLVSGESAPLARIGDGRPRIGKYVVFTDNLERLGVRAINQAVEKNAVVVIDEVGPMELLSQRFINSVELALRESNASIVTVHFRSSHPLAQRVRREATRLIELRRGMPRDVLEKIVGDVATEVEQRSRKNVAGR